MFPCPSCGDGAGQVIAAHPSFCPDVAASDAPLPLPGPLQVNKAYQYLQSNGVKFGTFWYAALPWGDSRSRWLKCVCVCVWQV